MNEMITGLQDSMQNMTVGNPREFILMLAVSLIYGVLLRYVYGLYFRKNEPVDASIARSFAIIAPGVTTIFWLIQYSLPLSLGLLGALSFVRFRTPVKRAEDIAFLLLTIAISLACAVLKLWVGLVLIALVLVYSLLRNKVLPVLSGSSQLALITAHTRKPISPDDFIRGVAKAVGRDPKLVSSSRHDGILSVVMQVHGCNEEVLGMVTDALTEMDDELRIDSFFPGYQLGGY